MPAIPPRACIYPNCKATSTDGSNYCPAHKPKRASGWAKFNAKNGNSRHKAGYGAEWDKLRKAILIRDRYLCQSCLKLGVMTEAKHVDHIINKALGGTNDPSNLQALCVKCHKIKTQKEAKLARYKAK